MFCFSETKNFRAAATFSLMKSFKLFYFEDALPNYRYCFLVLAAVKTLIFVNVNSSC